MVNFNCSIIILLIENEIPSMRDLHSYAIYKYAPHWKNIGIELGLHLYSLENITANHSRDSVACLIDVFQRWLEINDDATWESLEVALTNVNRVRLGLDPVDNIYGKDVY